MTKPIPVFSDKTVRLQFEAYPHPLDEKLLALRNRIYAVALHTPEAGAITESLKWGQPSYRAARTGSPIRLDGDSGSRTFGFYVHCQTDLIAQFKTHYEGQLELSGNRGVHLRFDDRFPTGAIDHCIKLALTYHARKVVGQRMTRRAD